MKIDLTDTTSSKINKALVKGRRAIGTPAVGMVLTLVIVTDEENAYDALKAANEASREHPSRTLVVIKRVSRSPRDRTKSRLDAEVRVGADAGTGETVVLRLYGEVVDHAQSVVLPLLLPDAPVVVWWPVDAPRDPAKDPLGALGQRRVTDTLRGGEARRRAAGPRREPTTPGDTDLAWTRITPWRSMLAAALDQVACEVISVEVAGEESNPSVELLAMWLADRLHVHVRRAVSAGSRPDPGAHGDDRRPHRAAPVRTGRWPRCRCQGQPDRAVALKRRETSELIAEELRRLDPDDTYASALRFGVDRLGGSRRRRSGQRRPLPTADAPAGPRPLPAAARPAAEKALPSASGRRDGDRPTPAQMSPVKKADSPVTTPQLVVHRDKELMAQAAAARLITKIVDAQAARGYASVVLTGGRNGNGLLAALATAPARDAIDWAPPRPVVGRRAVPARGRPGAQRHAGPRGAARLGAAGPGPGARRCPRRTARTARTWTRRRRPTRPNSPQAAGPEDHGPVPTFDVLMLGVGPDTHVASLFPELPAVRETERTVVGVHGAPKPPPTRISLTLPAIRAAREVWLLAAGEDKAEAAAIALSGAGEIQAPAAGAYGRSRTLWLLDAAAASQLPRSSCIRRRRPDGGATRGRTEVGGAPRVRPA